MELLPVQPMSMPCRRLSRVQTWAQPRASAVGGVCILAHYWPSGKRVCVCETESHPQKPSGLVVFKGCYRLALV